jgi:hypothetical protein
MDRLTSTFAVVGWLQRASTNIEEFVDELSAVDWVLLALAAVALCWLWAILRSLTRLGPVEVATIEHDGQDKAKVLALTAALREQLARTGLVPPPSVPAGAPQANLIAAVEASPIPQGPWIGKVLEALPSLPRPPRYKVSGTLIGDEPASRGPRRCGISLWVSPDRDGAPLLDTIDKCASHSEAVTAAASKIYVHIARNATGAFPIWVRWRSEEALDAYREGCAQQARGELAEAQASLENAIRWSPFNVLARLQVANLYEQRKATTTNAAERISFQAEALRRYLQIAREWPGLVEPRYRVSVIAAALGAAMNESHKDDVVARLWLTGTTKTNLDARLRQLASRESVAVLQLLRPWYALLRERRLRSQFEPKAHERRGLKHVVRISKHCVRLRASSTKNGRWTRAVVQYRVFVVHFGHMLLGLGNLTWQAYYNAACFDALLLARREPTRWRPRFPRLAKVGKLWRKHRDRVRRERALRNLDRAIREAGSELSPVWVAEADPDLAFFRNLGRKGPFYEVVGRMPQSPIKKVRAADAAVPPTHRLKPIAPPARPWGNPMRRVIFWSVVAGIYPLLLLLGVLAMRHAEPWQLILVTPLILAGWRIWTAARDSAVEWEAKERKASRKPSVAATA